MAGFEVIIYGRFWVITEARSNSGSKAWPIVIVILAEEDSRSGMVAERILSASIQALKREFR
jgi:hypothetical protein